MRAPAVAALFVCGVFAVFVTPAAASDASTLCVSCDTAYQCTQYAGSGSNVDWFCCPFQKQCIPIDDSDCLCRDGTSSKYGDGGNNFRVENDPNSCGGGKPCHYCSLGDTTTVASDTGTVASVTETVAIDTETVAIDTGTVAIDESSADNSAVGTNSTATTTEVVTDGIGNVSAFITASLISVVVWVVV